MSNTISGAGAGGGLGSIIEDVAGGGEGSSLLGGLLGSGGGDPEAMLVDVVGKMLGLDQTELGIAKMALGAVTGDPLAVAAGVESTITGIASGQSPFDDPKNSQKP